MGTKKILLLVRNEEIFFLWKTRNTPLIVCQVYNESLKLVLNTFLMAINGGVCPYTKNGKQLPALTRIFKPKKNIQTHPHIQTLHYTRYSNSTPISKLYPPPNIQTLPRYSNSTPHPPKNIQTLPPSSLGMHL